MQRAEISLGTGVFVLKWIWVLGKYLLYLMSS